jgi:hypothetical protein
MSSFFLFCLYQLTRNWSWFHKIGRFFAFHIEVKIIKFVYFHLGFKQLYPRNSIYDSSSFNVFMSDLDFSIVIDEEKNVLFIQKIRKKIKYFLPNIGEFEFYNKEEWIQKNRECLKDANHIWNEIRLIRKLNWQRKSLASADNQYSKVKYVRGINITLSKMKQSSSILSGENVLRHLKQKNSEKLHKVSFPHRSIYLETNIFVGDNDSVEGVKFESSQDALVLYHLLPTSDYVFSNSYLNEIKKYLVFEELLTSKSFRRAEFFKEIPKDELDLIDKWIFSLEKLMLNLDNVKKI